MIGVIGSLLETFVAVNVVDVLPGLVRRTTETTLQQIDLMGFFQKTFGAP